MNKVFNINLGGYPFTIDENAYHHLKQYLGAIDEHFKNSEGFEDITTDIEARLAEIFQEKLSGRQIVSLRDVTDAINIMGTPEDFGAESNYTGVPEEEAHKKTPNYQSKKSEQSAKSPFQKFGKRLYRNPDEIIIGGVASGISAYFGIEDPVWIRIAFVVFTLSGGLGIPLYIILWIALPEARTAKQKLEMRGEKIDVNSIAKTIEEEIIQMKERITGLGEELTKKQKGQHHQKKKTDSSEASGNDAPESERDEFRQSSFSAYGSSNSYEQGIAVVQRSANALEGFARAAVRPIMLLVGVILTIVVAALWFAFVSVVTFGHQYINFIVPLPFVFPFKILAAIVMLIPIISMTLAIIRIFFRTRIPRGGRIALHILFVLATIGLSISITNTARDFEAGGMVERSMDLSALQTDSLTLTASGMMPEGWVNVGNDRQRIDEGKLHYKPVSLTIGKSETDNFELKYSFSARGRSTKAAEKRAAAIRFEPILADSTLELPQIQQLSLGEKWRNQQIEVDFRIPVGKSVTVVQEAAWIGRDKVLAKDGYYYPWQLANKTITMTEYGIVCPDCEQVNVD